MFSTFCTLGLPCKYCFWKFGKKSLQSGGFREDQSGYSKYSLLFFRLKIWNWATSWENLFILHANNKDADRCLDSIIPLVSISKISSLYLASVAAQAGLSLPWSQTPKTDFLVTWLNFLHTVMILSFQTDRANSADPDQEQSDQGLHCLPFCRHLLDAIH